MTIDTNELRRRTEWGYKVASDIVIELLDRLEAAEKERNNANAAAAGVALHAGNTWRIR